MVVRIINNKVGHDFPTGPLDIIQAWIELEARDANGRVLFHTGQRDERKNFIETGTFMFKAEPVDRYGNLIDRHNLWEMVGVRFKRSLFPGSEELASFAFECSGVDGPGEAPLDEAVALPVGEDLRRADHDRGQAELPQVRPVPAQLRLRRGLGAHVAGHDDLHGPRDRADRLAPAESEERGL